MRCKNNLGYIRLIDFDPVNKTCLNVLNLGICDLKLETQVQESHKLDKVTVILLVPEATAK
jgi:hypothetical protein